jgi:hypothetical protein
MDAEAWQQTTQSDKRSLVEHYVFQSMAPGEVLEDPNVIEGKWVMQA